MMFPASIRIQSSTLPDSGVSKRRCYALEYDADIPDVLNIVSQAVSFESVSSESLRIGERKRSAGKRAR
jgi:hypothetical protein